MPSEVYLMPFLSVLASLVLVIASLYWAKAVLIPLALALMLTFLLQPIVAALHRRGLGHMPAVVLVVVLLGLRARSRRRGGDYAILQPGGRAAGLSRQPQT